MEQTDILISGGGVAGLAAAAAFGSTGFRTIVVDPAPPVTDGTAIGADLRSTAFLQPARAFLTRAGLWDRLAAHATPLRTMRIVDAGGTDPVPRVTRDFDADEIGDEAFGWNFPNWLLRREIVARLADIPHVTFLPGTGFARVFTRESEARVTLNDGRTIRARLVIAADGRQSPAREAAGIGVRTLRYGQKAVVFAVTHPVPHDNISTEVHRTGGPFTLVPLPDHEGQPCSAVVWMDDGPEILRLAALPDREFETEATARSAGVQGPLQLVTRRQVWPIISQMADRLTAERLALVAEAAHVVPPIGAQGLNMSLRDLATLLDLAEADREGLGGQKMLDAYARARHADIRLRVMGIDALNRASRAESHVLRDMRSAGVRVLHDLKPVRLGLMKLGLGAGNRSARDD
jgi:2-octaprenyl-6-methoxyphenol hydroxylase